MFRLSRQAEYRLALKVEWVPPPHASSEIAVNLPLFKASVVAEVSRWGTQTVSRACSILVWYIFFPCIPFKAEHGSWYFIARTVKNIRTYVDFSWNYFGPLKLSRTMYIFWLFKILFTSSARSDFYANSDIFWEEWNSKNIVLKLRAFLQYYYF